jgi:hypothetical protein
MSDVGVAFYKAVKQTSNCLVCHTHRDLTFHHVEPAKKLSEVHKVARNGGLFTLMAEFNKCVPLCWEHHAEVHKGMRPGWLLGLTNQDKQSHSLIAQRFMPYIPYWAARNQPVVARLYQDHVTDGHNVIGPLLKLSA